MLIIVACADYIARRRDGAKCGRVAIDPPTIEFVAFSSDASYVNHFWFSAADHAISENCIDNKKSYLT